MSRNTRFIAGAVFIFMAGFMLGNVFDVSPTVNAQAGKVFELRTYTTPDGLLLNLQARFRDHTMRILRQTRHAQRRVLGATGFARVGEHPHLHHLARQPSGCGG